METRSTLILAGAVVLGFTLHALLQQTPGRAVDLSASAAQTAQAATAEAAHRHRLAEIEAASDPETDRLLFEHGSPRVIGIQGEQLLYAPEWKRSPSGFTLTPKYYRLVDGRLVRVPTVDADAAGR